MALNRKLTPIVKGRTIESIEQADKLLSLHFGDGSILNLKTSTFTDEAAFIDHSVKSIRQKGAALTIDFDDKTSALITLADPGSSVMLRDGQGILEYID